MPPDEGKRGYGRYNGRAVTGGRRGCRCSRDGAAAVAGRQTPGQAVRRLARELDAIASR
ncbi:hypothetical protein ACWDE9_17395 [Streptomyces olivaceoviridis]